VKANQAPKIATDIGDINKPQVWRKKKIRNGKEELVPSLFEANPRLKFLQRFKSANTDFVKTRKFTDRPGHRTNSIRQILASR
jgi:hypothetical protein